MTAKPSNLGLPQAGPQVVSLIRGLAVLACATAVLALAPAAPAADRLDRAADALKREPLYVHPDLLWLVPEGARARVTSALRGAPELRLAVMPMLEEDESGGRAQRALDGIRRRVDRPGRYLLMNEQGSIEMRTADGERLDLPTELRFPDERNPQRPLPRLLAAIRLAPSTSTRAYFATSELPEVLPLPGEKSSSPPWRDALAAAGIGLGGGVAAFVLFAIAAGGARRLRA
jgi:hypothetical protein